MRVINRRCFVCGEKNHACGPKTTVEPVDTYTVTREGTHNMPKRMRIYKQGNAFVKLSDDKAHALGLLAEDGETQIEPTHTEPTIINADPSATPMSSEAISRSEVGGTAASPGNGDDGGVPEGALAPGGTTSKARGSSAPLAPSSTPAEPDKSEPPATKKRAAPSPAPAK